jgi:hypothetical protein
MVIEASDLECEADLEVLRSLEVNELLAAVDDGLDP